jgi:hypothetical protein
MEKKDCLGDEVKRSISGGLSGSLVLAPSNVFLFFAFSSWTN